MPANRKKHPAPPPDVEIVRDPKTKEVFAIDDTYSYVRRHKKGWIRRRHTWPEPAKPLNPMMHLFRMYYKKLGFA